MMGFAQGIDICYGSTKDDRNVVFFQDGTQKDYRVGGILEEVMRDDIAEILVDRVREWIDKEEPKTDISSAKALLRSEYLRLCEAIEIPQAPSACALFRSTFYEALMRELIRRKDREGEENSAFLKECYETYIDEYATFAGFVEAVAASNSGVGDEQTELITSMVEDWADHAREKLSTLRVTNWLSLLLAEYSHIRKRKKRIRFCANCGRIFVPQKRSDTIYCDGPAPQNMSRCCNEIGAQMRRKRKRGDDGDERAHHNTICRLHNMVRRARSRGDGKDLIEYYRRKIDAEMLRYENEKHAIDSNISNSEEG